ncbi:Signal transduction histidine kinase [Clostridium cavendishii DSM 21758]|uniref:histidine kinase n=1 Tax=Clostridium cavendishii DSM 21758 TaxID=1121302 RepID=A0A1M6UWI8_9CLOT|nr:sensor histidine kinase [Clostridium cavendishii]SHK73538.1 Signal transduction histidine kinase [Clostridium cavendishii DSM 21758]
MWNKKLHISIKYFIILSLLASILMNSISVGSKEVLFILIFIINNQVRFFSLENDHMKKVSFLLEVILSIIAYKYIGGYLIAYLVLQAMDSNTLFKAPSKHIFNILIIVQGIVFSLNNNLEFKYLNIFIPGIFIAILYLVKDENDKKVEAQELYDRIRISEEKLKNANRDLEIYASSVEELTLLRERNRLSREIHDSVGHALSTIAIQLGAIERLTAKDDKTLNELTKELRVFTQKSLNEVRMAVREIKPKEFEEYEGILAIEELIKNFKKLTGIEVRLGFSKEKWRLNSDQSFVLYRIVQEFLSNSVRHGKATVVNITMNFIDDKLIVTLKDNGIGQTDIVEGVGLKSMRERVTEIGGFFSYDSISGEGFLVKVEINKIENLKIYSQGDEYEQD